MDYVTIGTYTIPYTWIALLGTIFFFEIKYRKSRTETIKIVENALWIYLISWKLSYIPLYFSNFIQAPLSLLYFDGGLSGHAIALFVVICYLYIKRASWNHSELVVNWIVFVALFQFITSSLSGQYALAISYLLILAFASFSYKFEIIYAVLILLIYETSLLEPFVWLTALFYLITIFKERKFNSLVYLALVPFVVIILSNFQVEASEEQTVKNEMTLMTTDGERYSMQDQEDEIIIANFFATWCPPCKAEMPHLQSFAEDLPDNVQLIGVNLSARDNGKEALQNFMLKYKVSYPVLLDEDDFYGKKLTIRSIPTTFIFKNGVEVNRLIGPVSESMLQKIVLDIEKQS